MGTRLLIGLIASLVSLSAVADAVKTDSNVKLSKWFEVPRNDAIQVLEDRESYPFSFNWEVVQEQERASARISGDYSGLRWPKTQMDLSSRNPWWKSPRRLLRVVDGWLAGYNAGEFGAELWWFSKDGSRHYKISNHQVNQFLPDGDVVYAAEGSPSDLVEGSIIKLEKRGGRWKAKTFAKPEMDAPSGLVKMDDASFIAVGRLYSWTISKTGTMANDEKLSSMLSAPYFSTAARDGSTIYLGSEYFVMAIDLKTHDQKYLVPTEAHWKKIKDAFIPLTEDQSINKLLQVVRAYLPEGWSESYESQDRCLEVFRDKAVEIETGALANGPPDKEKPVPVKQKFTFAFRIVAMVSPADHHRLTSQLGQDAAALYDKLLEMRVSHKAGSFSPRTDAEKAMVARYEALQHELHSLPDFYFRSIGLQAQFDPAALPEIKFSDARVRDECTRIQQGIVNLLSRYEDAPTSALPPRPPVADP